MAKELDEQKKELGEALEPEKKPTNRKTAPKDEEKEDEDKKEEDATAVLACKRHKLSKEYCQPFFDRFIDNYKHYFLRIIDEAIEEDPEVYPFYSTLTVPVSFQTVETVVPRMFSKLPSFNITTEEENDEEAESQLKELIKYQLQHPYLIDDPIFLRIVTFLKEMFITGNAWGEVPWVFKEAEVLEHQPYSIQMGTKPDWSNLIKLDEYGLEPDWALVKTKKTVIDAPVFQHRSIFHVFPDPKKKRVSDLGWIIVEDFLSKEEVMDLVNMNPKKYQNIDQLEKMKEWKGGAMKADMAYDEEMASIFGSQDFTNKDCDSPLVKVWFMKEKYKFSIIINEKITIREGDNPNGDGKIGMFLCKDIPVPNQLFAWGEIDPIKKIEDSMSDQANMRNDRVFKDLLDMWKLDPTTLIDGEEFIPEPGVVVQVNDMTGIQAIESKQANASAYREYEEWDKILQATTGASDYVTGGNEPGMTDTAEGISLMQQAANARFMLKLNLFEQIGLKAMGVMYVQRNRMFFDKEQKVMTDKGPLTITPNKIRMIRGNVNFIVDSNSTEAANSDKELRKWKLIIDMVAKGDKPFDNLSQESYDYVARKMLLALNEKEPDQILKRNPMPAQVEGGQPGVPGAIPGIPGAVPGVVTGPGGATPPAPEEVIPQDLQNAIEESQAGGQINNAQ